MIDKSKRKATAERSGNMVVVRMTGGPDCMWLNMYLDTKDWQMTCDSDIGDYAYHWFGRHAESEDFIAFCCRWLANDEWLLRKCIGERHVELEFDSDKSAQELRRMYVEANGDDCNTCDLEYVLETANEYSNKANTWVAAVNLEADLMDVCLPDEWYACVVKDYTPWQRRFAEICREVIVPVLLPLRTENGGADDGNQTDPV